MHTLDDQSHDHAPEPEQEEIRGLFVNTLESCVCPGGSCASPSPSAQTPIGITEELLVRLGVSGEAIKSLKMMGAVSQHRKSGTSINWTVDSGAAVTCIPRNIANDYPLLDRKSGRVYKDASGNPVPDEGLRKLVGRMPSSDGPILKGVKARVARVAKCLLSVAEVVDNGGEVRFAPGTAWMRTEPNGSKIEITRRGKTYELDMDMLPFQSTKQGFTWPG